MSRNKKAMAAGLVLLTSVMVAPAAQADPDNWPANGGPRGEFDPSLTVQEQPAPAPSGDSTDEIILGTVAGVLVLGGAAGVVARRRYLVTHPRTAHHAM